MNGKDFPEWITSLEPEELTFIKNFILKSGSLKEIAKLYDVSYPTVRLRLDRLIQKIQMNCERADAPFQSYIRELAIDSSIDLKTAKEIIQKYEEVEKTWKK